MMRPGSCARRSNSSSASICRARPQQPGPQKGEHEPQVISLIRSWQLPRQRRPDFRYAILLGRRRVQLLTEALVETSSFKEARVAWSAVQRIEADRRLAFVDLGAAGAFIIPSR